VSVEKNWVEESWLKNIGHGFDWHLANTMSTQQMRHLAEVIAPKQTGIDLIRLGGTGNGGYLVPDDLEGLSGSFSPGIGQTATFDEEMLARDIPCFLADASVSGPPISHPNLTFDPLFLGPETNGRYISLDDWVARHATSKGDLILQMDIEGAEYDVFAAASDEVLSRFRVVLVEFHRVHLCLRAGGYKKIFNTLEKLHKWYVPVHIHPNNARPSVRYGEFTVPRTIEISYLRRDRVKDELTPVEFLPHALDVANIPSHPDPALPAWMWQQK